MLKNKIQPVAVLSAICVTVALLLSVVNIFTAPKIKEAQEQKANAALLEVLPEGKNFTELTLNNKYPAVINKAYKADGGYVFQASVTGKSSDLIIMCGVSADGKIVGTRVIANNETKDYAAKVFPLVEGTEGKYKDMDLTSFEPQLVSGATLTSKAYADAVKAALQAFVVAGGGEVDLRTPEQILSDNCNAAMNTQGKTFVKWFATEEILVDGLYTADGVEGAVAVIGEKFIALDKDGKATDPTLTAEEKANAEAAFTAYSTSELTEVTIPEGAPAGVKKIEKTASGNYVIEAHGEGYGILGEYNASGKPIVIRLALTESGKIISTLTVSQEETPKFGGPCGSPDYYEQYNGKTEDNYTEVEGISGATFTSNGYKKAVKDAFAALKLLKGDATE